MGTRVLVLEYLELVLVPNTARNYVGTPLFVYLNLNNQIPRNS